MEFSIAQLVAREGDMVPYLVREQSRELGVSEQVVRDKMRRQLEVMKASILEGLDPDLRSVSGLTGGQAALLNNWQDRALLHGPAGRATAYALAVAECNACMGRIVAAPTAGSCGILPGCLIAYQEYRHVSDDALVDALFVAAAFGHVIAANASISGAEGGCQAECGSAAAMAAAALVFLSGGTALSSAHACAFAILNSLGLVCDPVGGLVEVPCVYRNVGGVGNAFTAADMALCGIPCPIPCDEVILAMRDVGDSLPSQLRETGEGGCAACPSMRKRFT